ncbi:hypothetical protein BDW62DRAFT_144663 [Aspergillus aurantiobrunneus]
MAKGILGKSRSPPQTQGISKPLLRYTDAIPRNDLRDVERGVSYSRPIHQDIKAGQHPGMSEGRNLRRITEVPTPQFDFQGTSSPAQSSQVSGMHLGIDEGMIGIALGSPRLLESHNMPSHQMQRIPPPTPPEEERPPSALQRKSSKWRKIGGLFKAKNAMASNANKPFYQVRPTTEAPPQPAQDSTHSIDYRSRQTAVSKTGPIVNTEVWPCLVSENEALARQPDSSKPKVPGSFLQVEIPPVEMERYSVMFGGLLNNNRPSLLDRRSKTLDNVTIPGKESSPPQVQPRRRATSPVPSQSPSFSLFPTMPTSKASKVLGTQNLPQAPDPLRRTQTLLESQSQDRLSGQTTLKPDTYGHNPKERSSHRPHASVTSFLSATSISSDDEHLLIHKVEPVRTYAGMKEPESDWNHPYRKDPVKHEPQQKQKLTINTRELRSDSNSSRSTAETSSPILSPMNSARAGVRNQAIAFPPPRTTSRAKQDSIPAIEVSVARSVSVSKGKKQVLVPVRTRTNHFNYDNSSNERLVVREAKTPKVTSPEYAHRPGLSQDVHIEMV